MQRSLSVVLTAIIQVDRVSQYQNVSVLDFIGAKSDGGGGNNRSYIGCAKLQAKCHHQQTNTQFFNRLDALPVTQPLYFKKINSPTPPRPYQEMFS